MFRRGHRYNVVHSLATQSPHAKNSPRPQLSRSIRRSQLCFTLVMPSPADLRRLKSASFGTGDRDTGSSMLATLVVRNNIITRCGFGAPALGQQRSGYALVFGTVIVAVVGVGCIAMDFPPLRGCRRMHSRQIAVSACHAHSSFPWLCQRYKQKHMQRMMERQMERNMECAPAMLGGGGHRATRVRAKSRGTGGAHTIPLVRFKTAKDASCNGYRKDRPQNRYFILPSLLGGTVRLAGCAA